MSIDTSQHLLFTLAFYGIHCGAEELRHGYELAVEWFNAMGYPPARLGVQGAGFTGNFNAFSRVDKRLHATGFNVQSIEIESARLGLNCVEDCGASAVISNAQTANYAVFSADIERFHLASKEGRNLAATLVDTLSPEYGIAYSRPLRNGPTLFALGVNAGGPIVARGEEYERRVHVSAWGSTGIIDRVYRQGLLRDVYSWNFLTEPQLRRNVVGSSLEKWICENPIRGRLNSFANNVCLWEVEEPRLSHVRDCLQNAGAIFHIRSK